MIKRVMINGGDRQTSPNNTPPIVSVIMATYNAGHVLQGALDSFIEHAPPNAELIVIDGQSQDNTVDLLKKYNSNITFWQSEPDGGIYDALNKGAKVAKGQWLYFIGADDRLLQGFAEMCTHLKRTDTLYYGNVETDGPLFLGKFTAYRLAKYCINHQTIFYPASIFKTRNYNTRYKVLADYALNIACWGDSDLKKQYYPINVAFYSTKGYSSVTIDEAFQHDKPALIKKHMSWFTYLRFLYKSYKERSNPNGLFKTVNPQ